MLSAKRWRPEATARLVLSVLICIFLGSLAVVAAHYIQTVRRPNLWFFALVAACAVLLAILSEF